MGSFPWSLYIYIAILSTPLPREYTAIAPCCIGGGTVITRFGVYPCVDLKHDGTVHYNFFVLMASISFDYIA